MASGPQVVLRPRTDKPIMTVPGQQCQNTQPLL
jgi:hypothetical protein